MAKVKPAFATTPPVAWLSGETGKAYRLLSDSGREYVARAGTTTPFHTGETIWLLAVDLPAGARMRLFGKGGRAGSGECAEAAADAAVPERLAPVLIGDPERRSGIRVQQLSCVASEPA